MREAVVGLYPVSDMLDPAVPNMLLNNKPLDHALVACGLIK
jgi:hypothetical protein